MGLKKTALHGRANEKKECKGICTRTRGGEHWEVQETIYQTLWKHARLLAACETKQDMPLPWIYNRQCA